MLKFPVDSYSFVFGKMGGGNQRRVSIRAMANLLGHMEGSVPAANLKLDNISTPRYSGVAISSPRDR